MLRVQGLWVKFLWWNNSETCEMNVIWTGAEYYLVTYYFAALNFVANGWLHV